MSFKHEGDINGVRSVRGWIILSKVSLNQTIICPMILPFNFPLRPLQHSLRLLHQRRSFPYSVPSHSYSHCLVSFNFVLQTHDLGRRSSPVFVDHTRSSNVSPDLMALHKGQHKVRIKVLSSVILKRIEDPYSTLVYCRTIGRCKYMVSVGSSF